ncbi:hypothetical protein [Streptomyces sp. NPDC000410]|uniref:hypothetical protein n=1 Tax=Streptomyces sp. NPDC000410 TaxID=3154254 RepID=UPI0033219492
MTGARAFARREWGSLYGAVRTALAAKRWRAVPMALTAVCLTALCQLVQNQSWGYGPVHGLGSVRAEDPLWLALLRTPLSLFVPALDLPVWGALAQVLVVFGIAEICMGRRRTLVVAYLATLAGTTYARLGIWLGPDSPLGLPGSDARVVDTGPSAAVVGLAVYVCFRHRAWLTMNLVIVAMVVEVFVKSNLAGKEHLAAIVAVLLVCAVSSLSSRFSATSSGASGTSSGASGTSSGTSGTSSGTSEASGSALAHRRSGASGGGVESGVPPIRS